jgi:transcriptional regulator with XRE-family HTH domain
MEHRDPQRRPRPVLRTHVGDALRRNRLAQRRTLADVARAARVSVPYLSEVERGRKEASSEVLAAVCDALRIDLSDLLAEVWRGLVAERTSVVPIGAARKHRLDLARRPGSAGPRRARGDVVLLAA